PPSSTLFPYTPLFRSLLRVLSSESQNRAPGPEGSILKIRGSEIGQALYELTMQACGHAALPYFPEALEDGWTGSPVGAAYAPARSEEHTSELQSRSDL